MPHFIECTAYDLMSPDVFTIPAGTPLADAAEQLVERHISGAPVVAGGKVVGVLSLFDLVSHSAFGERRHHGYYSYPPRVDDGGGILWEGHLEQAIKSGATVDSVMTRDLISVAPEEPIPAVAKLMVDRHIHRVLVMNDGKLVGLLSTTDILAYVAE